VKESSVVCMVMLQSPGPLPVPSPGPFPPLPVPSPGPWPAMAGRVIMISVAEISVAFFNVDVNFMKNLLVCFG
jgi:hypothetical protein